MVPDAVVVSGSQLGIHAFCSYLGGPRLEAMHKNAHPLPGWLLGEVTFGKSEQQSRVSVFTVLSTHLLLGPHPVTSCADCAMKPWHSYSSLVGVQINEKSFAAARVHACPGGGGGDGAPGGDGCGGRGGEGGGNGGRSQPSQK